MKASEILRKARELPFTKGTYARDSSGQPVGIMNSDAVCFCTIGAVARVSGKFYRNEAKPGPYELALDALRDSIPKRIVSKNHHQ